MHNSLSLDQARKLTVEYATYARSESGLGNVVGAVLILLSAGLSHTLPIPPLKRVVLGGAPLIWVVAKEVLRSRYYQQFGQVEPSNSVGRRVYATLLLAFSIAASILSGTLLIRDAAQSATPVTFTLLGSLLILAAVPFVVHRYLGGKYEFITGLFLMLQSASLLSGNTADFLVRNVLEIPALLVAFVMFFAGIEQHRRFLELKQRLVECERERE